jgi:hypothetical protein
MIERVEGGKVRLNLAAKALQEAWQKNPSSHIWGPK